VSREHRIRVGLGLVALCAAALVPAGTAGAATRPNGAICRLDRLARANLNTRTADAATQALIKGDWPLAKKDLVSVDTRVGVLDRQVIAALSSAPTSVQRSARALLALVPAEIAAVRHSTSTSRFETAVSAIDTPAVEHEATQVADYEKAMCEPATPAS
jgi:hypothetical protein